MYGGVGGEDGQPSPLSRLWSPGKVIHWITTSSDHPFSASQRYGGGLLIPPDPIRADRFSFVLLALQPPRLHCPQLSRKATIGFTFVARRAGR
jgi:hypothetical protein